jgi:hypothetical protein
VNEVISQQVGLAEADLQILRDENVVLESERNPQFRRQVRSELERVKGDIDRIGHVVESAS